MLLVNGSKMGQPGRTPNNTFSKSLLSRTLIASACIYKKGSRYSTATTSFYHISQPPHYWRTIARNCRHCSLTSFYSLNVLTNKATQFKKALNKLGYAHINKRLTKFSGISTSSSLGFVVKGIRILFYRIEH